MVEDRYVYIINKNNIDIVKNEGLKGLQNTIYFSIEHIIYKKGFFYINDKKIPFSFDF